MSNDSAPRVLGVGGVFLKSPNPEALLAWYHAHLGLPTEQGFAVFPWTSETPDSGPRYTVFTAFPSDSDYFGASPHGCMMNLMVVNLDALLIKLRAEGVSIDPKPAESSEFGRFAWIFDPEGRKIELWEPPAGAPPSSP